MLLTYLNGSQTRRAGSVDAVAGSGELEVVVDPAGTERTVSSRNEVCADLLRRVRFMIVVAGLAVKCADALQLGSRCAVGHVTCTLKRFVRRDDRQSLHGTGLLCFTWRHVEEGCIEQAGLVDEAAVRGNASVHPLASGVLCFKKQQLAARPWP